MTTTEVQIGLLTIAIDQEAECDRDFLDGLERGMQCYYDGDVDTHSATVADMIENFNSITDETADFVSLRKIARAWLAGFVMGWMTGLNNPELADDTSPLSWAECLTRKHTPLYRDLVIQADEAATEEHHSDTEPLPVTIPEPVIVL
jgi:hypothetical protein